MQVFAGLAAAFGAGAAIAKPRKRWETIPDPANGHDEIARRTAEEVAEIARLQAVAAQHVEMIVILELERGPIEVGDYVQITDTGRVERWVYERGAVFVDSDRDEWHDGLERCFGQVVTVTMPLGFRSRARVDVARGRSPRWAGQ